jgi:hypothetical protein
VEKQTYFVLPLSWIVAFTIVVKFMIATLHTLPLWVPAGKHTLYGFSIEDAIMMRSTFPFSTIYATVLFMFLWTHMIRVAMIIELAAKWTLMGHARWTLHTTLRLTPSDGKLPAHWQGSQGQPLEPGVSL